MGELGDLLELLHRGGRDVRTVRARLRVGHDGAQMRAITLEAMRRSGAPREQVSAFESQAAADVERSVRLWLEAPDRHREEVDWDGQLHVRVRDGDTWWQAAPGMPPMTNRGDAPTARPGPAEYQHLFDPAPYVGLLDLEPAGTGRVAGREVRLAAAHPRPAEPPYDFALHRLGHEADGFELAVDARTGVLLRAVALRAGARMSWVEVEEVAFDEDLDPALFRLEPPPGEDFLTPRDAAMPRMVGSLAELAREAPFAVFAPREVPAGWRVTAYLKPAGKAPAGPAFAMLHYASLGAGAHLSVLQQPDDDPQAQIGTPVQWRREGDLDVGESEHGVAAARTVREGTRVELSSQELEVAELARLAGDLERVSPQPPRFA